MTHPTNAELLVVGAGPQALTVVARIASDRPGGVRDVVVVDPAGRWLDAWNRALDRQGVRVLRSPGVHHPAPDDMAFISASAGPDGVLSSDGAPAMSGPLKRPSTVAFRQFCHELAGRTGLDGLVQSGSVVDLRRDGSSWCASLADGRTIAARRVVWAGNPQRLRLLGDVSTGARVAHAHDFDRDAIVFGERVAVIGGGQSAGRLALEVDARGAEVIVVSRSPRRLADLDIDAGWLMDDHLVPFRAIDDPSQRRVIVDRERRGSMTADLLDELAARRICCLDGVGEIGLRVADVGVCVGIAGAEVPVDRVILATGSTPDVRADKALAMLVRAGAPHVDGLPVISDQLEWLDGLYVVGGLAALALGPAAGNLGGARLAADTLRRVFIE